MAAFGTFSFGAESHGGTVTHDRPTVTLVAPTGTVTTGGPTLDIEWTYDHDVDAQGQFRVEITDDAGTTTHYDSGWISGANDEYFPNILAESLTNLFPPDTEDISVRVSVRSTEGPAWWATTGLQAFIIQWGIVTVQIDEPPDGSILTEGTVTVEWTFASTRSKTQAGFRVELFSEAGASLYDTGFIAGTGSSYEIPFALQDGSTYTVQVTLVNSEGVRSE